MGPPSDPSRRRRRLSLAIVFPIIPISMAPILTGAVAPQKGAIAPGGVRGSLLSNGKVLALRVLTCNVPSNFFKVCVRIKCLLCNIFFYLNLSEFGMTCLFGMTCMKDVQTSKQLWREHLCALQVFLCALISRPVCGRTRARLRGNISKTKHRS